MSYQRRKGTVDLRRASLATLEKHLAEARIRVSSIEKSLAENKKHLNEAPTQLAIIQGKLAKIEAALLKLRALREPKGGPLGGLLGLTRQPEAVKPHVLRLEEAKTKLEHQQWELENLRNSIGSWTQSLERMRAWSSKLEEALARKRRKGDALIELRAAAATNATQTRRVGLSVKRNLIRQPWCPYCGGVLGADPHVDHIYPVSKGGRSVPKNMVYACASCNGMKANRTLAGFIRKFSLDRAAIEHRLEQLHKEY